MAVSELALQGFRDLHQTTLELLDLSRNERWDDLVEAMNTQQAMVRSLESDPPDLSDLSEIQRQELENLLRETDQANREAITRAEAWRGELKHIIGEFDSAQVNNNRLARAYRG